MKTLSIKLPKGFCHPTRMGYERLEKEGYDKTAQVSSAVVATRRRRPPLRIKAIRRVNNAKLTMNNITLPKKWLAWARDTYIKMMLHLATLSVYGVSYREPPAGRSVSGFGGFGRVPVKEYDRKVIVEIYTSLVVSRRQLTSHNAII